MRKYKDPMLQALYASALEKGATDFMRRRGGSLQSAFMDGYNGVPRKHVYGSSAWAAMMAGKDRRRLEEKGRLTPAEVKNKRLLEKSEAEYEIWKRRKP